MKHSEYFEALERDPSFIKGKNALKTKFTLGDAILHARLDKGLSQTELAKQVGTRQANISRIEAGNANPTLDLVHRLLEILNLTLIIAQPPMLTSVELSASEYYDYEGQIVEWPLGKKTSFIAVNINKNDFQ
jgi:transcriptional regulator with XRE-family HTH domain